MTRLRTGDAAAHGDLYRRFSRSITGYIAIRTVDRDSVSDLTQDVFLKAFQSADAFHGRPAALLPWLRVIAKNTTADHARKNDRLQVEDPAVLERRREAEAAADPDLGANDSLCARLSRDQERVVFLRYDAGFGVADVALALGKSPDAVRHLEHRALASMRAWLARSPRPA